MMLLSGDWVMLSSLRDELIEKSRGSKSQCVRARVSGVSEEETKSLVLSYLSELSSFAMTHPSCNVQPHHKGS